MPPGSTTRQETSGPPATTVERRVVLLLWSVSIGRALLAGAKPYPRHPYPSAHYPWQAIIEVCARLTLEALLLYLLLCRSPVPRDRARRVLVAAMLCFVILVVETAELGFHSPPWSAITAEFAAAGAAVFVILTIVYGVAERLRSRSAR